MITRKGVSEVITVTLIIVITVIIAGVFFAWSKETAKNKMNEVTAELKAASDLDCTYAEYFVDSCTIYNTTKDVSFLFTNNSNLKIFNLVLTVQGKNESDEDLIVIGRFDDIVDSGELVRFSTDTNFTFTKGDQTALQDIVITSINNVTLTNGTCPKEPINLLNCEVVNTFWPPESNTNSGTYYLAQNVTLSADGDANIYYTTNGTTPDENSTLYTGAIIIPEDTNTTLKAIATGEGYLPSAVNTWTYHITHTLDAPTADPAAGTYYGRQNIALSESDPEDNVTIRYTTNGTVPTVNSTEYNGTIFLGAMSGVVQTIKAKCFKDDFGTSSLFTAAYIIEPSIDNLIYTFNVNDELTYDIDANIDNDNNTIVAELPNGTDLGVPISPTITNYVGALVSPRSNVSQDFSVPVNYTVTAESGATRVYTVTLTTAPGENSIVYDEITGIFTLTVDPDIFPFSSPPVIFRLSDALGVKIFDTDSSPTTELIETDGKSPYEFDASALAYINLPTELFLEKYNYSNISSFDIIEIDNNGNVVASIPLSSITVIGNNISALYDESSNTLTITLDLDIDLKDGAQIIVYDDKSDAFITTDKSATTIEMGKVLPSPYELEGSALGAIGFDTSVFMTYYGTGKITKLDVVDGLANVLATIPVSNITVVSK